MRHLVLALALASAATAAHAQGNIPDLKGIWSGKGKAIVGADSDGYYRITLLARDRMEKCYVHKWPASERLDRRLVPVMERVKK
jgi:hypothetical protein